MFTVSQIRPDIAPFVNESGAPPDSPLVLDAINASRRLLWTRGDFNGVMTRLLVNVVNGTLTLPADCDVIRQAWTCNGHPLEIREWYRRISDPCLGHSLLRGTDLINQGDDYATWCDYYINKRRAVHRIRVFSESEKDENVRLVVNAYGENNNHVIIPVAIGKAWEPVSPSEWIYYFRNIQKPRTDGRIHVSIFDPNNEVETECAVYEPDDINPHFRRYGVRCNAGIVEVRAKRRYRELFRESDTVEFPVDALIQASSALTMRRQRKATEYQQFLTLALEVLMRELGDQEIQKSEHIRLDPLNMATNL